MLLFNWRKIRFNLLGKKFSKYFLYAIGEIFLVVIGILIAVQLNNWNENRKNSFKEQVILKQLLADYVSNLAQLEEKIHMRNEIITTSKEILDCIDNPKDVIKDSLYAKISILNLDPTFDPISNDLMSTGNLQLISNEELKNKLSHWTSDVMALREMELEWQKMTLHINFPFIIRLNIYRDVAHNQYFNSKTPIYIIDKNISHKLDIGKSKKTAEIEDVLNNPELETIITRAMTSNYVTNLQSYALKNKILDIITLLKSENKK